MDEYEKNTWEKEETSAFNLDFMLFGIIRIIFLTQAQL